MLSEFAENSVRRRAVETSHAESLVAQKGGQEAKFGPSQIRTGSSRTDALEYFATRQSHESSGTCAKYEFPFAMSTVRKTAAHS